MPVHSGVGGGEGGQKPCPVWESYLNSLFLFSKNVGGRRLTNIVRMLRQKLQILPRKKTGLLVDNCRGYSTIPYNNAVDRDTFLKMKKRNVVRLEIQWRVRTRDRDFDRKKKKNHGVVAVLNRSVRHVTFDVRQIADQIPDPGIDSTTKNEWVISNKN